MKRILICCAALTLGLTGTAHANGKNFDVTWEVSITNITKGQTFTPILAATHERDVSFFMLGEPASESVALLAEAGVTDPLASEFEALGSGVGEVSTTGPLLAPGETRTIEITGSPRNRYLSVAAMLIPTNDTFFALQSVRLPSKKRFERTWLSPGYDAGSEVNDQDCDNMPGPRCNGAGPSPDPAEGDEGFVHIGNGFHDLGFIDPEDDSEILGPFTYDWRNPVAKITIRRIR